MNTNEKLMLYLYDLKHDIDKYKYNTFKKKLLEYKYNTLLSKIQQVDNIIEKMNKIKL